MFTVQRSVPLRFFKAEHSKAFAPPTLNFERRTGYAFA